MTKEAESQKLLHDSGEKSAIILEILQQLQKKLTDHESHYAVLVNVEHQFVPADLIAISEHGMGLMILQHEPGSVSRDGDVWCANGQPVTISDRLKYRNPHQKVQLYAEEIRNRLMHPTHPGKPWLPGRYITWQDLIFDTAVCFTHPDAEIEYFRKYYYQEVKSGKHVKQWERFAILERDEIPRWVENLCFEQDMDNLFSVQSYRMTSTYVGRIMTDLFEAPELTELPGPSSDENAYGYLLLRENGEVTTGFPLDREEMTVGRDPSCDIVLPRECTMVSRVHGRLKCSPDKVFIEDQSRNGTFINGVRIFTPALLDQGQQILLGGNKPVDGVCVLEFSMTSPAM